MAAQPAGDNVNPLVGVLLGDNFVKSINSVGPLAVPLAYVLGQSAIKNVAASSAIHMGMLDEVFCSGVSVVTSS